jgi:Ca2+/Na+ antiporter
MFKKLRKFYKRSNENKIQISELIGSILIPVIVLLVLYVCVLYFWK